MQKIASRGRWYASSNWPETWFLAVQIPDAVWGQLHVREHPFNLLDPTFGHCPNSDWTHPPELNRALWDWALWDQFEKICKITVVAVNKCPKPSGQAFRPPNPNGQCPNVGLNNYYGSSLSLRFLGLSAMFNSWYPSGIQNLMFRLTWVILERDSLEFRKLRRAAPLVAKP